MPGSISDIELCWRRDLLRLDRASAANLLRGASGGAAARAMRRLLAEGVASSTLTQLDDAGVLALIAARIETGEIVAFRRRGAQGIWTDRIVIEPEEAPVEETLPMVEENDEEHWLQIRLVDDDGNPVPGERYRVELPDGTVIEGVLDSGGMARVNDIDDPGNAIVTFPDADEKRIA
jgi:uncharacterized protein (DUF2345 family)